MVFCVSRVVSAFTVFFVVFETDVRKSVIGEFTILDFDLRLWLN